MKIQQMLICQEIVKAINEAERKESTAEKHLQMIKYADRLSDITAKEFCEATGLTSSYATEFSKMRNITKRLIAAGLDVDKI